MFLCSVAYETITPIAMCLASHNACYYRGGELTIGCQHNDHIGRMSHSCLLAGSISETKINGKRGEQYKHSE